MEQLESDYFRDVAGWLTHLGSENIGSLSIMLRACSISVGRAVPKLFSSNNIRSHDGSESEGSFRNVQTCGKVCSEFKILSIRCLAGLSVTQLFTNCLNLIFNIHPYQVIFHCFDQILRFFRKSYETDMLCLRLGQKENSEGRKSGSNRNIQTTMRKFCLYTVVIL